MNMSIDYGVVSADELTVYRRVVYTALFPFLDTDELLAAMWCWEEEYASLEQNSQRAFVGQLCQGPLQNKHNSILFNLNCHTTDGSVQLKEDPYRLMVAYRSGHLQNARPAAPKSSVQTENMQMFSRLLRHMSRLLEEDNRYYTYLVRVYVGKALGEYQAGLSIEQVNELRAWMHNNGGVLAYDYSAMQMSSVLNLLYVGVCEYFGPEKGNEYHAMSIRLAEAPKQSVV